MEADNYQVTFKKRLINVVSLWEICGYLEHINVFYNFELTENTLTKVYVFRYKLKLSGSIFYDAGTICDTSTF